IGDVDGDGVQEVCVGTNYVHILQWNGTTYEEEHVITDTYGLLAVTCVGDFDNDGKIEINAGAVGVSGDESYKSWIFKYGLQ
ncbi:MAG: VCBS repeat-containing protein, partial [Thermoplasmata archaeon]|nr:VCBS repeat-containing protein [Thermoplasmata archaeon]